MRRRPASERSVPLPKPSVGVHNLATGSAFRRRHIIPIFVENPDDHELEEGKGVDIPGREVSEEVLQTVFVNVCDPATRYGSARHRGLPTRIEPTLDGVVDDQTGRSPLSEDEIAASLAKRH